MSSDPARILFTTKPQHKVNVFDDSDSPCKGCLFEHEHSRVCRVAGEEAKKRGLGDCEIGLIYIAVKIDPRQQDLFE